jgi:hypothetical protein
MARSPFSTAGSVQDIAPVQLRGGFSSAPGVVDAVNAVAQVAVPAIRDNLEQSVRDDVTGQTQSVRLALQATRFPSLKDTIFSEEALANPVVQQALEDYTKIQDAAGAGRLPSQFAMERLEQIQLNAVRNAPDFEQEIKAAMQDATGQRPTAQLFGAVLREPSAAAMTPEQKAEEQLRVEAAKNGVTVDEQVAFNNSVMQNQVALNKMDLAKRTGEYNVAMMGSEVRSRSGLLMLDALQTARQLVVAGDPLTPDTIQQLKSRISATVSAATGQLLAQTKGLPIDGGAINAELTPLRELQTTLNAMIDDGSLQTLVSDRNKVTTELIKEGVLTMPELAAAYAIGGSRGFTELLQFMESAGNSAQGKALISKLIPKAGTAFNLQAIGTQVLQQYSRIGTPDPVETASDKQARILASGVVLGTKGVDTDFQMKALEDIRKYGGEELAWSSFDSNKVLTATSESNEMKAAFINMQVATSAGLTEEMVTMAHNPEVDLSRLKLEGDALVVEQRPLDERIGQSTVSASADAQLQTFVSRFNRANRISGKYQGAGILPASRYGTTENYWNTIKEASLSITASKKPDAPTVVEYVRDENGNIVPVGGE